MTQHATSYTRGRLRLGGHVGVNTSHPPTHTPYGILYVFFSLSLSIGYLGLGQGDREPQGGHGYITGAPCHLGNRV